MILAQERKRKLRAELEKKLLEEYRLKEEAEEKKSKWEVDSFAEHGWFDTAEGDAKAEERRGYSKEKRWLSRVTSKQNEQKSRGK